MIYCSLWIYQVLLMHRIMCFLNIIIVNYMSLQTVGSKDINNRPGYWVTSNFTQSFFRERTTNNCVMTFFTLFVNWFLTISVQWLFTDTISFTFRRRWQGYEGRYGGLIGIKKDSSTGKKMFEKIQWLKVFLCFNSLQVFWSTSCIFSGWNEKSSNEATTLIHNLIIINSVDSCIIKL